MRAKIRERANQFFVRYPRIGQVGYDFLRISGIDRSTHGTKPFLKKLAQRGFAPQTIIDVGANHGGWSRIATAVYPQANFVLIEPQAEMAPFLNNLCASNPKMEWIQAGAGAENGELALTVWDDYQGSAFLTDEVHQMIPYAQRRQVPIITLNSLITEQKIATPDFVKIDVQGFEMEVLRGATRCLGQTELFILEAFLYHPQNARPNFYKIVSFMESYGYAIYDFTDMAHHPQNGALSQVNVCFVLANSNLR